MSLNNQDINKLKSVLSDLYAFLRDEGYSVQATAILHLLYCVEQNDLKSFKKGFRSSIIRGGAGSVEDIDFREPEKRTVYTLNLDEFIRLGKQI